MASDLFHYIARMYQVLYIHSALLYIRLQVCKIVRPPSCFGGQPIRNFTRTLDCLDYLCHNNCIYLTVMWRKPEDRVAWRKCVSLVDPQLME